MCSHINYSFGKININLIKQYDSNFKRKKNLSTVMNQNLMFITREKVDWYLTLRRKNRFGILKRRAIFIFISKVKKNLLVKLRLKVKSPILFRKKLKTLKQFYSLDLHPLFIIYTSLSLYSIMSHIGHLFEFHVKY